MERNQKLNVQRILIAILVFVVVYFGVKTFNKPKVVEGEKAVQIIVLDEEDKTAIDKTFNTDALLLGDLIDEINKENETFILEGSIDSEFGRFILEIVDIEKDESHYWIYDSENNSVCLAEEFCPGIDSLAIEDLDIFVFSILK